jgi:glycerol-3-phosphate dehydrogenase
VEVDASSGLISILGGKWTTYRAMAEDTVNAVQRSLAVPVSACKTSEYPLSGSDGWQQDYWMTLAAEYGISKDTACHLSEKFGTAAFSVLELVRQAPQLSELIVSGFPAIQAEAVYCIREEMAITIEDVLARRVGLQFFSWRQSIAAAPIVGSLLGRELGWSPIWQKHEVEQYVNRINHMIEVIGLPAKQALESTKHATNLSSWPLRLPQMKES